MRVEIGGAQVTESIAELLESLQTDRNYLSTLTSGITRLTRMLILDSDLSDSESLGLLRVLQTMARDIELLANPPELNDPANDTPAATF